MAWQMAQDLTELMAFPKNLCSIPGLHMVPHNSSSREYSANFWPLWALQACGTQMHMQAITQTDR